MHGEYKVPGGKLIVVDLEVVDRQLRNVVLSGDFFLAPEEALEWIRASIEGQPAAMPLEALAARIAEAGAGAELLGLTPEGVAIAVRRAIDGGSHG